jgi:hypothetical protein
MKKILALLFIIGLAGIIFTGCQKDEDEAGSPTISFLAEAGYISGDATLLVNEEFKIKVSISQNVESQSELKSLTVGRTFTPATKADWDTTFSLPTGGNQEIELTFNSANIAGSELIELTVTDANNKTDMVSLTITTELPKVTSYPNNEMGSYNEPAIGSFFATSSGTVYSKNDAFAVQDMVDFGFYLGSQNGSTFASPADPLLKTVFDLEGAGWTTYNETMFINPAPIDASEFDAIGDAYAFPEFDEGSSSSYANKLNQNDVVYFKTHDGYRGFIKVNSINGRGDKVNIDVKVEQ